MQPSKSATWPAVLSGQCHERLRIPPGFDRRQMLIPVAAEWHRPRKAEDHWNDRPFLATDALLR